MYSTALKFIGYHGTYPEHVDSIKENNFRETENHNIWIGDGVYFFIEGVGDESPIDHAKLFAIDQCFDNDNKTYSKNKVCVLEAVIKVNNDKCLDLTNSKGNQLFNKFRGGVLNKIQESGYKTEKSYRDADVFKLMRKMLGIEFVKANVYFKFGLERKKATISNIPNVTIFVVNNPKKNILKPSIRQVYEGGIL